VIKKAERVGCHRREQFIVSLRTDCAYNVGAVAGRDAESWLPPEMVDVLVSHREFPADCHAQHIYFLDPCSSTCHLFAPVRYTYVFKFNDLHLVYLGLRQCM